jgi:CHAT domain-containing protein
VKEELRSIVREKGQSQEATGVLPGRVFLDKAFTKTAMRDALGHYQVVHIASHFSFKPGNESDSFLLLGDGGSLTLEQIRDSASPMFTEVELLTLSACDTATGGEANGTEVEGFAVLAQEQGAQAVLATLWPVYDESTGVLMQRFYKHRAEKAGATKVEALQQAQLSLLSGQPPGLRGNGSTRSRRVGTAGQKNGGPPFTPDPNAPYAHPYFWAPFILIGNWR